MGPDPVGAGHGCRRPHRDRPFRCDCLRHPFPVMLLGVMSRLCRPWPSGRYYTTPDPHEQSRGTRTAYPQKRAVKRMTCDVSASWLPQNTSPPRQKCRRNDPRTGTLMRMVCARRWCNMRDVNAFRSCTPEPTPAGSAPRARGFKSRTGYRSQRIRLQPGVCSLKAAASRNAMFTFPEMNPIEAFTISSPRQRFPRMPDEDISMFGYMP